MRKRLIKILICACFLIFICVLSSCDLKNVSLIQPPSSNSEYSDSDSVHNHDWSTTYSFNENFHWVTCKTCNALKETAHDISLHGFNECKVCKQSLGIIYEISSDGSYAIVTGYNQVTRKVRIPSFYKELPVKVVGENAFTNSFYITTVIIPETVTTIENEAFRWCYKLTEVVNYSPSITVEKGAEANGYVGFRALSCFNSDDTYECEFIDDNGYIVYTDGDEKLLIDYVGEGNRLVIPDYITKIHSNALEILSVSSVIIPQSVTAIGDYAFKGCRELTEITIPDSVVEIGDGAFRFCYKLHTAQLGNSVQHIGDFAFHDCKSLTKINIPDEVTSIGTQTFMDCESLTYIKIPDSVSIIHNGAFRNCKNLANILIGGIIDIQGNAFGKCENLQTIFYNGTQAERLNIDVEENDNQDFLTATLYFRLDAGETFDGGYYWHYDENGLPVIYSIE